MSIQHLELISSRSGHSEKLSFFDGVLWVAQGLETSAAVWLSARWFQDGDLDRGFDLLKNEVGTPTGFKMVGSNKLVAMIEPWIRDKRYKVLNHAVREGSFEVRFFAKECKIQISRKLKVLVVDDSKTIRNLLTKIFSSDAGLEVVGSTDRPSSARVLMEKLKPDVITLDLEMPEKDGLQFLKEYLPVFPIPTVMVTAIGMEEGTKVLEALESGAVDYIQKPSASELTEITPLLIEKIKMAGSAKVNINKVGSEGVSPLRPALKATGSLDRNTLIAIGSSTGGTEALRKILTELPEGIPPIVITQHIPAVFSKAFADRLNTLCPFRVKEAAHGDEVVAGSVYVAPGGKQMQIKRRPDGRVFIVIDDSAPVNRHKPSVDYLFDSVYEACGQNCIGVILTGMGSDGAKGLLKLKRAGARTIAQDEKSSAVFGMPREAIRLDAAQEILPLKQIAQQLMQWLSSKKAA
jgi:two-component system chemotaxis response regulator CheB